MKKMKKIFALLLVLAMVLGMTTTAFATTATAITVSGMPVNDDGTTDKNTIVKYVQVVVPSTTNVTGWDVVDTYTDTFKDAFDVNSENEVIEKLVALGKLEDRINYFASEGDINNKGDILSSQFATALNGITATNTAKDKGDGNWEIEATEAGLYVITATADGYSYIPMAAYVGYNDDETALVDAVVKAKGSATKITKDVVGTDDDSVSEGDEVEFTVTTEYPYYENSAEEKTFVITDILTNGTFVQKSVLVKVGTTTLKAGEGEDYVIDFNEDNNLFEIKFNYKDAYASGTVTLTYKAIVGAGAGDVVNNIKSTFDTTGDSVTLDKVEVEVIKVDDKNNKKVLDGAKFAIYEAVAEETDGYETVENVTVNGEVGTKTLYLKDVTANSLPKDVTEAVTGTEGTLTFVGLDAQKTYYIKEIVAPEGYSLNDDYYLLINAGEIDNTSDKVHIFANFNDIKVKDIKLSSLPSTGGIGTTIFTIGGCAIMIAAAFFFFISRRKDA